MDSSLNEIPADKAPANEYPVAADPVYEYPGQEYETIIVDGFDVGTAQPSQPIRIQVIGRVAMANQSINQWIDMFHIFGYQILKPVLYILNRKFIYFSVSIEISGQGKKTKFPVSSYYHMDEGLF